MSWNILSLWLSLNSGLCLPEPSYGRRVSLRESFHSSCEAEGHIMELVEDQGGGLSSYIQHGVNITFTQTFLVTIVPWVCPQSVWGRWLPLCSVARGLVEKLHWKSLLLKHLEPVCLASRGRMEKHWLERHHIYSNHRDKLKEKEEWTDK